jgi:hypothetical protein
MAIDKTLIDQLLGDYKKPEDIIGENGLLKELSKATLERALQAELTDHLGLRNTIRQNITAATAWCPRFAPGFWALTWDPLPWKPTLRFGRAGFHDCTPLGFGFSLGFGKLFRPGLSRKLSSPAAPQMSCKSLISIQI